MTPEEQELKSCFQSLQAKREQVRRIMHETEEAIMEQKCEIRRAAVIKSDVTSCPADTNLYLEVGSVFFWTTREELCKELDECAELAEKTHQSLLQQKTEAEKSLKEAEDSIREKIKQIQASTNKS